MAINLHRWENEDTNVCNAVIRIVCLIFKYTFNVEVHDRSSVPALLIEFEVNIKLVLEVRRQLLLSLS